MDLTDTCKAKEPEKTGFCLTDMLGEMEMDEDFIGLEVELDMDTQLFYSALHSETQENRKLENSKAFIHPSCLTYRGLTQ